jgi:hypothetical protein
VRSILAVACIGQLGAGPVPAVDVHVGRHIFKHAIQGMLKDKAVLLITNQARPVIGAAAMTALS